MANAPDTLIVTGPNFQQVAADLLLVTPPGGSQETLVAALAAGPTGFTPGAVPYAGANGMLTQDFIGHNYSPTAFAGGATLAIGGAPGNDPIDATFQVFNPTPGQKVADFHQKGAQSVTGGAIVSLTAIPVGAAMLSGNRLGALVFSGSLDATQDVGPGASIEAFATQNFSIIQRGANLKFSTPTNNVGSTVTLALTIGSDQTATFTQNVTAPSFTVGTPTITSGAGAPGTTTPNGSLYMNTTGGAGTRLYVSNGTTWAAVAGV